MIDKPCFVRIADNVVWLVKGVPLVFSISWCLADSGRTWIFSLVSKELSVQRHVGFNYFLDLHDVV